MVAVATLLGIARFAGYFEVVLHKKQQHVHLFTPATDALLRGIQGLFEVSMTLIGLVIRLAPYAVFCFMFNLAALFGWGAWQRRWIADDGLMDNATRIGNEIRDGLATDYVTDAVLKSAKSGRWTNVKKA